jgi:hypothetical protein
MHDFSRVARAVTLGGIVAGGVLACDAKQPLVVKDPDVASPSVGTGPGSLPLLRTGTLADFAVAVVGAANVSNNGNEGFANWGAIFTDEFETHDTFPTRTEMDTRDATATNSSIAAQFLNQGAAHNDAIRAFAQFSQFGAHTAGYAEMLNVDGMLYVYTAEHYCSGVPFSTVDINTGKVTFSQFLTTAQMFDTAVARFQAAHAALAGDTSDGAGDITLQREFATVATARALLDLGLVAEAADTAASMSDHGFQYTILTSVNTTRQENGIWNYTSHSAGLQVFGVADGKNTNGLPHVSSPDPRVPFDTSATPAENGDSPFFEQLKFPLSSSPFVVADYTEAQLIVAEGDIFAGNYAGGRAVMNALRAGFTGIGSLPDLPDFSDSTQKVQMQQLLTERAEWMYVTGHRLGDWRRMLRPPYNGAPFSFVQDDVFGIVGPPGNHILSLPTPQQTNPNPNYVACDPSVP